MRHTTRRLVAAAGRVQAALLIAMRTGGPAMGKSLRLLCLLAALPIASARPASAGAILFNTMPTNPGADTEERGPGDPITTHLDVGPSDVAITGFGTFGSLEAAGNVKWLIFDDTFNTPPLFSTAAIP